MKCFHHNDYDGRCAASWVYRLRGDGEFFEVKYNDLSPFGTIEPEEQVYIVDFSVPPEKLEAILELTPRVVWIDHHKTSLEKYANFPHLVEGIRLDGVAACVLTWRYLSGLTSKDGVPRATLLIGDRDVWAWQYGDETKYLHAGLGCLDTTPKSPEWERLDSVEYLQRIQGWGRIAEEYRRRGSRDYLKSWGWLTEFEGHKAVACNKAMVGSEFFGENPQRPLLISYVHDGKRWVVSLYSTSIDVAEIAKKYGGGGHKGASGFVCDVLPFKRED